MKEFPKLEGNTVAILRAHKSTGHVLDDTFQVVMNDTQNVYTTFDSIEEAQSVSNKILAEQIGIEIIIYGPGKQVLHYLRND